MDRNTHINVGILPNRPKLARMNNHAMVDPRSYCGQKQCGAGLTETQSLSWSHMPSNCWSVTARNEPLPWVYSLHPLLWTAFSVAMWHHLLPSALTTSFTYTKQSSWCIMMMCIHIMLVYQTVCGGVDIQGYNVVHCAMFQGIRFICASIHITSPSAIAIFSLDSSLPKYLPQNVQYRMPCVAFSPHFSWDTW